MQLQMRGIKSEKDIPRRKEIQYLSSLPIDSVGTLKLPQIPTRDLVQEYFIKRSISDDLLKEHFLGMISSLFAGIAAKDEQAV